MNNFTKALDDFLSRKLPELESSEETKRLNESIANFFKEFPKDKLMDMEFDDYVFGKYNESHGYIKSFCYYLEIELHALGSIRGGQPIKFGVYFNKGEDAYKTSKRWDATGDINRAFIRIKEEIVRLLTSGEQGNLHEISKNKLSKMIKNKILFVYYPDKYLNVSSEKHVEYFLQKLGINYKKEDLLEEKRLALIEFKRSHDDLKHLTNHRFTDFLYYWSQSKYKTIAVLPVTAQLTFPDKSTPSMTPERFLRQLFDNDGVILYEGTVRNKGNTLLLFQFDDAISGSAILQKVSTKTGHDGKKIKALKVDLKTIEDFNPIPLKELQRIDESFKGSTENTEYLDTIKQNDYLELIEENTILCLPDEIDIDESRKYPEGSTKTVIINRYERDRRARRECLKKHGYTCKICEFDFGKVYGSNFEEKIHVHHKSPLHQVPESYEVDPINDLIPVCPNCHAVIHANRKKVYSVDEVKKLITRNLRD